jgi:hypothetical protein
MFRAKHRPSSGAWNWTSSLWFCIIPRKVAGRCQVAYATWHSVLVAVRHAGVIIPEVVFMQSSSWGWAHSCSKHVEDSNKRIIRRNCASSWLPTRSPIKEGRMPCSAARGPTSKGVASTLLIKKSKALDMWLWCRESGSRRQISRLRTLHGSNGCGRFVAVQTWPPIYWRSTATSEQTTWVLRKCFAPCQPVNNE